ncbi:hypothetical protein [Methanoculleus taiwanensis]|uniref:hypothetical protein n=1 Tax=Methanoculleus taiwanensis TaxID=1550565 RepID=UPI000FFF6475|nr:hypothetical protein [Methanoculleus taiwanensis]
MTISDVIPNIHDAFSATGSIDEKAYDAVSTTGSTDENTFLAVSQAEGVGRGLRVFSWVAPVAVPVT